MTHVNPHLTAGLETQTPAALKRIADSVSNLMMPNLSPLAGAIVEMRAALNIKRQDLLNEKDEVQQAAWDAAARLMLPSDGSFSERPPSYFDHIKALNGHQT